MAARLRAAHQERVALVGGLLLQRGPGAAPSRPRARATAPITAQREPRLAVERRRAGRAASALEAAADAFDLGDDAVLGVDVDPRRVEVERHRQAPAVLDRDDDLAAVLWRDRTCVRQRLVEQLGGVERVLRGPILGLGRVRVDRLERALERRQVRAGARLLVLLVAAAGRERDAPDGEHGDSDDGDQPPHPHSERNLAPPDRLLIVRSPTFVQQRQRSLRDSVTRVVASAVVTP